MEIPRNLACRNFGNGRDSMIAPNFPKSVVFFTSKAVVSTRLDRRTWSRWHVRFIEIISRNNAAWQSVHKYSQPLVDTIKCHIAGCSYCTSPLTFHPDMRYFEAEFLNSRLFFGKKKICKSATACFFTDEMFCRAWIVTLFRRCFSKQ